MTSPKGWKSFVSLVVLTCLLAVPVSALGKKGKSHFDVGMKYEKAEQWEKAAQEFTLALAADPSNVDYQLHYRRAVFNASQSFMQQGRALAEQRDYVGAYNAFRQAFGYDPVNQLAVSEMERMLRLEQVKQGGAAPATQGDGTSKSDSADGAGTPAQPSQTRTQEPETPLKVEPERVINFSGDLKQFIRMYAEQLNLNVIFDRQSFAQPRSIDVHLRDVTVAKALDYIFLQENLFFQKLDRHTILVADQTRRPQYQQLVVRTFFIANSDPDKVKTILQGALPPSVGRPQPIFVPDKDTNSLTVRDTAENVRLVGDLIESIDKDRAEVVMDVDIYEVSRSDLLQLGNQLGQGSTLTLGGSPGIAVLSNNGVTSGNQHGVNLSSLVAGSPTGLAAALVVPPSLLTAFQSKTNSRLLASTQIHAFNNEESTARIGQRVPVQTASVYGVTTATPTATPVNGVTNGVFSNGYPVINYEPTGLTLTFTPQVFPNLDVQVKMKIESKDVSGANSLTPTFTERTLTGTARVQNNRTMMLASVSQNIQGTGRQGLPVVGGLPIVGRFFTSPTKDNRQVDIVIAVTPRVLRAPAVTPRDEEMRPSGTLQAPTIGSLEAMLRENEREDMIAAARRIPKDVEVRLPADKPTYEPAAKVDVASQPAIAKTEPSSIASPSSAAANDAAKPQVQPVSAASDPNRVTTKQSDGGPPQPKSVTTTQDVNPPKTIDVATALKDIVSSPANVSTTNLSAKQDGAPATNDATAKTNDVPSAKSPETTSSIVELAMSPEKSELAVGEKRQIALQVKSDAPLGMALVTLRIDPKVLKITSVTAGSLFASAKTAPTLTQSIDDHGMILLSVTPAAGSALTAEGNLLNIEVEALASGDSNLAFDLSNVHLVAGDGRALLLQIGPVKLTVK